MCTRYYNPDIKRFINHDVLAGSIQNSQSLNRYSYVQGNSLSYTDPFGLSPINTGNGALMLVQDGINEAIARGLRDNRGVMDFEYQGGSETIAKYGDDFGKMGTYVENPKIKVDWSQYAEHAAERMKQRGMPQELIDDIVNNGKVLSQNCGNKYAYITQDGVAIVSKDGKLITAWGKSNFDENMLDVISKLVGE